MAITQPRARSKVTYNIPKQHTIGVPSGHRVKGWYFHLDFSVNDFRPLNGDGFLCASIQCPGPNYSEGNEKCTLSPDDTMYFAYLPILQYTSYECIIRVSLRNAVYYGNVAHVSEPIKVAILPSKRASSPDAQSACPSFMTTEVCGRRRHQGLDQILFAKPKESPTMHDQSIFNFEDVSIVHLSLTSQAAVHLWYEGTSHDNQPMWGLHLEVAECNRQQRSLWTQDLYNRKCPS